MGQVRSKGVLYYMANCLIYVYISPLSPAHSYRNHIKRTMQLWRYTNPASSSTVGGGVGWPGSISASSSRLEDFITSPVATLSMVQRLAPTSTWKYNQCVKATHHQFQNYTHVQFCINIRCHPQPHVALRGHQNGGSECQLISYPCQQPEGRHLH